MIQGAVKKLQEEIEKFNTNPLAQVLGQYVMGQCESKATIAEAVVNTEKTLEDLAKHITGYAKSKAVHGMAMLPDEEVFGEALKFYGVGNEAVKAPISIIPVKNVTQKAESVIEKPKTVSKPKKTKQTTSSEGQVTFFDFGMGV